MNKKYLLKEKIPNTQYEVGHIFETNEALPSALYLLMMTKLGILEEVGEECQNCKTGCLIPSTSKESKCWCDCHPIPETLNEKDWTPKNAEMYYHINARGLISRQTWDNTLYDFGVKSFLGIYRTRDSAQKALDEILVMLKKKE